MPVISIVIPTLNEEAFLEACLENLVKSKSIHTDLQIIVSDSGSSDSSILIAKSFDVVLVVNNFSVPSKALALNAGAEKAIADVILFLDADTKLPTDFDLEIYNTLKNEEVVGGAFELTFDAKQARYRLIELINRVRCRLFPYYFGDQALFVRRSVFEELGGFPAVRIMETSRLCKALWKRGKLNLINKSVSTSSRRFDESGIARVFLFDFSVWFLDILGFDVQKYASRYWDTKSY